MTRRDKFWRLVSILQQLGLIRLFRTAINARSDYPHAISKDQAQDAKELARRFYHSSLGTYDAALLSAINNLRWADVRTPFFVRSYRRFYAEVERLERFLIRRVQFHLTDPRL